MEDRLRFSRFTHLIPVHDLVAVYNAANLAVLFVSADCARRLAKFQQPYPTGQFLPTVSAQNREEWEKVLLQMKDWQMLVAPGHDDSALMRNVQSRLQDLPVTVLYLLLTDVCNFACQYCFIEGELPPHHRFSSMSAETAKMAVDLLAQALSEDTYDSTVDPNIIFYGGEPLLNWDVMKSVLQYVAALKHTGTLPANTRLTLNTNASLITREIARSLAVHGVTVAVSMDGSRVLHNEARTLRDGTGTFDTVMKGVHYLQETDVSWSVSCTISEFNLPSIEEVIDWLVETFELQSLGFNIVRETSTSRVSDLTGFAEQVSQALIRCYEFARERGIYEERIMRKVRSFVEGQPRLNDCAGCGQQIVAGPSGELGVCHGFWGTKKYFVRPTTDFRPRTHPMWAEWRQRSPFSMEQCYDCVALGICGGGCPQQAYFQKGSIWETDEVFCVHSKLTLKYLLGELAKQREAPAVE